MRVVEAAHQRVRDTLEQIGPGRVLGDAFALAATHLGDGLRERAGLRVDLPTTLAIRLGDGPEDLRNPGMP